MSGTRRDICNVDRNDYICFPTSTKNQNRVSTYVLHDAPVALHFSQDHVPVFARCTASAGDPEPWHTYRKAKYDAKQLSDPSVLSQHQYAMNFIPPLPHFGDGSSCQHYMSSSIQTILTDVVARKLSPKKLFINNILLEKIKL